MGESAVSAFGAAEIVEAVDAVETMAGEASTGEGMPIPQLHGLDNAAAMAMARRRTAEALSSEDIIRYMIRHKLSVQQQAEMHMTSMWIDGLVVGLTMARRKSGDSEAA